MEPISQSDYYPPDLHGIPLSGVVTYEDLSRLEPDELPLDTAYAVFPMIVVGPGGIPLRMDVVGMHDGIGLARNPQGEEKPFEYIRRPDMTAPKNEIAVYFG